MTLSLTGFTRTHPADAVWVGGAKGVGDNLLWVTITDVIGEWYTRAEWGTGSLANRSTLTHYSHRDGYTGTEYYPRWAYRRDGGFFPRRKQVKATSATPAAFLAELAELTARAAAYDPTKTA